MKLYRFSNVSILTYLSVIIQSVHSQQTPNQSCRTYATSLEPGQEELLTLPLDNLELCFQRPKKNTGRRPDTYHINIENFYKTTGGPKQRLNIAQAKRLTHLTQPIGKEANRELSRLIKLQNLMVLIGATQPRQNKKLMEFGKYINYGCHCFQNGADSMRNNIKPNADIVVDTIDSSCQSHQQCYACIRVDQNLNSYASNTPKSCEPSETHYKIVVTMDQNKEPEMFCDLSENDDCAFAACECDKKLALELYRKRFDYSRYNSSGSNGSNRCQEFKNDHDEQKNLWNLHKNPVPNNIQEPEPPIHSNSGITSPIPIDDIEYDNPDAGFQWMGGSKSESPADVVSARPPASVNRVLLEEEDLSKQPITNPIDQLGQAFENHLNGNTISMVKHQPHQCCVNKRGYPNFVFFQPEQKDGHKICCRSNDNSLQNIMTKNSPLKWVCCNNGETVSNEMDCSNGMNFDYGVKFDLF